MAELSAQLPDPICCDTLMSRAPTRAVFACSTCGFEVELREVEELTRRLGLFRLVGVAGQKVAEPLDVEALREKARVIFNGNPHWRKPDTTQYQSASVTLDKMVELLKRADATPHGKAWRDAMADKPKTATEAAPMGEIVFKNGSKLTVKRDSGGKHVGHLEGELPAGESVPAQVVDDRWTIGWDLAERTDENCVVVFDRGEQRAVNHTTWRDGKPQIIRLANGASIRYGPSIGWHVNRRPKDDCRLCDSTVKAQEDMQEIPDDSDEGYHIDYALFGGQPAHAVCLEKWQAENGVTATTKAIVADSSAQFAKQAVAAGWEWKPCTRLMVECGGMTCEHCRKQEPSGGWFRAAEREHGRAGWRCTPCLTEYLSAQEVTSAPAEAAPKEEKPAEPEKVDRPCVECAPKMTVEFWDGRGWKCVEHPDGEYLSDVPPPGRRPSKGWDRNYAMPGLL